MTVDAVKNIEDLAQFVCDSPVSYLAARTVARRLQAAGFTELNETEPWQNEVAVGRHFVMRDGATDSPSLKLKPSSSVTAAGWHQMGVENYGGALLNSFLDRELRAAGRLTVLREDGTLQDRYVVTGPLARVPQLAPHLDHKRNELTLDKQFNMYPIWGVDDTENDVLAYLAQQTIDEGGRSRTDRRLRCALCGCAGTPPFRTRRRVFRLGQVG